MIISKSGFVGTLLLGGSVAISQLIQAQTTIKSPEEIVLKHEIKSLPGSIDSAPVFNSNSPEWVKSEGILLSTFPPTKKNNPKAHLNYAFQDRFDIFAHHFSHTPKDLKTLYIGILIHNPNQKKVTINTLQGASYLMTESPFIKQPNLVGDPQGKTYSGPGARAVADVLRGKRQPDFPAKITLKAGESKLLLNHPIPVKNLDKPVNGRSTFLRLKSNGKIYISSMSMYAKKDSQGQEIKPTVSDWQKLLQNGNLATPRDKTPTPLEQTGGQFIYGRVAGVSRGASWSANFPEINVDTLNKPVSYPISNLVGGRLGTELIQTAQMIVRYPDTAYAAHGNYGVEYRLNMPFHNPSGTTKTVSLTLQTPIKEDKLSQQGLRFRQPPLDFPFFRGTVKLTYTNYPRKPAVKYFHLWQRRGELVAPLFSWQMSPKSRQKVKLELIYPPDSTPPQVLTIQRL